MSTRLLLLLCLFGQIQAKTPPDVTCLVVHLEHVRCSWNEKGTPEVNYTFSSSFGSKPNENCTDYLLENNTVIGCNRPYVDLDKFSPFHTVLRHDNQTYKQEHMLKKRVKLNPPTNLSVKNGSDSNLWFYWNQTKPICVESEVHYRINNNKWELTKVAYERQSYCINLPASNSRYELQVRSKISESCGGSDFWSDWSQSVVWGVWRFNNSTETHESMSVWTPVLYVVAAITLVLLVVMLLQHERLRIILVPVVPKPSLSPLNIEDWFPFSKNLMKEGFTTSYNEQACPVREYIYVPRCNSSSSDSSNLTEILDQTDCSTSFTSQEEPSAPFYSSKDSSEEEQKISV